MSNWLGVAAVTQTLARVLEAWGVEDHELADLRVTTATPDRARTGIESNQLNLFLYQVAPNAAWRNMDMPDRVAPNERGVPPLPLDLGYLMTAYGLDDHEELAQRALARAMLFLHDHPVIDRAEIQVAPAGSDLFNQVERVRVTPQSLSVDEMSKLWTMFQAPYRLSTAYQVSVVLLESKRPTTASLPVLRIGEDDRGARISPDLVRAVPTLTRASPPPPRRGAVLGDTIALEGEHLAGDVVTVLFRNQRISDATRLLPDVGASASRIEVTLPAQPLQGSWVAGLYSVAVEVVSSGPPVRTVTSAEIALAVAPQVIGVPVFAIGVGDVTLTLSCDPAVLMEQRVSALLGDRELQSLPRSGVQTTLTFDVTGIDSGPYLLRLRVDGVDSNVIDFGTVPPSFDGPVVTVP